MNTLAKLIASIAALIASLALAWIAKNGSRLWYDAPDHTVGYASVLRVNRSVADSRTRARFRLRWRPCPV